MLMQAEGLYQALFQHAGDAILLIDAAMMAIVAANPAAERLSGYTQDELCALAPASLIAPMLAGGLQQYEGALSVRSGPSLPVSIGVSQAVFDGASYLLLIVRDSSEQRRQSESGKLAGMGRLTASIAHEINNPLQALHNTLHLLLSRSFPEEKHAHLLGMAQNEVDRLATRVQRMLELHRPSSKDMRPLSVHGLLESALAGTASTLQQQHVLIERDWADHLPWVIGIGGHLRQVFVDLAINALESMPDGGRLMIRTRLEDVAYVGATPRILVEFADNGMGISESEVQHIFEPFYTHKRNSAGLGLAISYSIIERHGGTLSVSSGGHGSTFRVALPAALVSSRQ
ncbi:MAG: ATP-binding protein [Chloroflexota bacterium]|nr:ATP-binding protein [Chloroflexota bacterium]